MTTHEPDSEAEIWKESADAWRKAYLAWSGWADELLEEHSLKFHDGTEWGDQRKRGMIEAHFSPPLQARSYKVWKSIVFAMRETKPAMAAVLEQAFPLEMSDTGIVIGYPTGSFFGKQAEKKEVTVEAIDAAKKVLGLSPEQEFSISVRFDEDIDEAQKVA